MKKQCNMYHVMTMATSIYNKSCHYVYSLPENKICVTVDIIGQIDVFLGRVQGKAKLTKAHYSTLNNDMYFAVCKKIQIY